MYDIIFNPSSNNKGAASDSLQNQFSWEFLDVRLLLALYQLYNPNVTLDTIAQDFGFPNSVMVSRKLKTSKGSLNPEWYSILKEYAAKIDVADLESKIQSIYSLSEIGCAKNEYTALASEISAFSAGVFSDYIIDELNGIIAMTDTNKEIAWLVEVDSSPLDSISLHCPVRNMETDSANSELKEYIRQSKILTTPAKFSPDYAKAMEVVRSSLAYRDKQIYNARIKSLENLIDFLSNEGCRPFVPFDCSILLLDSQNGKVIEEHILPF